MAYQYFYIVWALLFLIPWVIIFLLRKDLRMEMLFISIACGFGGIAMEWIFLIDWWHPLTITGTPVGIEDFIWPFSAGGVAAVAYEFLRQMRLVPVRPINNSTLIAFMLVFPALFLSAFFIFHLSSFYTTMLSYLFGILAVLITRRDLAWNSIISSVLMLLIGAPIYFLILAVFPEAVHSFWYLDERWYTQVLGGFPLEEWLWLFLTGAFVGPLYEFLANKKAISA